MKNLRVLSILCFSAMLCFANKTCKDIFIDDYNSGYGRFYPKENIAGDINIFAHTS
ncbi:MAG: hypothetical protein LBB59_07530 [Campylobacteraceae bacterium]|nr:hypothetical protein [Campylobacteraceae bacterium]